MAKQANKKKSQIKSTRNAYRCRDTYIHIQRNPIKPQIEAIIYIRRTFKVGKHNKTNKTMP